MRALQRCEQEPLCLFHEWKEPVGTHPGHPKVSHMDHFTTCTGKGFIKKKKKKELKHSIRHRLSHLGNPFYYDKLVWVSQG